MPHSIKHRLIYGFIALSTLLLTACGSQDGANTDAAITNTALIATKNIVNNENNVVKSTDDTNSPLLTSLAQLYPQGQLPADRVAQADQELAQNPAALKTTAEISSSSSFLTLHPQATRADFQPVQRIQNTTLYGAYFFSIYPSEVTSALTGNASWRLEGPAFWASLAAGADLHPVHRFQNKLNGSYLYTIYDAERANIVANFSATFAYEGVAWYARQAPANGWSALYRFRNKTNGTYLFSAYESEKDAIVANFPDVFELEGIAYYVRQDAPTIVATTTIVAGGAHTCALKADNTVSCWGNNQFGPLGDGTGVSKTNPTRVPGLSGITALAAGNRHTCAVKTDGTVSCWGFNGDGQLGNGTRGNEYYKLSPTLVPGLGGVKALAAGFAHTCALKTDGTVSCWGRNDWGQLGDGTLVNKSIPTPVTGLSAVAVLVAGDLHTCAVKTNGTVSCWGNNDERQFGNGTRVGSSIPISVSTISGVSAMALGYLHTCAVKIDGTVSCTGNNVSGQLGDGTRVSANTYLLVPGLSGVKALTAGTLHTCALKTDSTVSCWGSGEFGQLGDNGATSKPNPTLVANFSGVAALAAGSGHTCALKTNGTVSCWGNNASGQLGDGTTTIRRTPTPVLDGDV